MKFSFVLRWSQIFLGTNKHSCPLNCCVSVCVEDDNETRCCFLSIKIETVWLKAASHELWLQKIYIELVWSVKDTKNSCCLVTCWTLFWFSEETQVFYMLNKEGSQSSFSIISLEHLDVMYMKLYLFKCDVKGFL